MNSTKSSVHVYFVFEGNCREAIEFYHQILGGTLTLKTYGEQDPNADPAMRDKILHAELTFGTAGNYLMACDVRAEPDDQAPWSNSATHISLNTDDSELEYCQHCFERLSEGGEIIMPFEKCFWNAHYGSFRDKYGIHWMINAQVTEG